MCLWICVCYGIQFIRLFRNRTFSNKCQVCVYYLVIVFFKRLFFLSRNQARHFENCNDPVPSLNFSGVPAPSGIGEWEGSITMCTFKLHMYYTFTCFQALYYIRSNCIFFVNRIVVILLILDIQFSKKVCPLGRSNRQSRSYKKYQIMK